jgi:hypothetical protein
MREKVKKAGQLEREIMSAINRASVENESDTPDFRESQRIIREALAEVERLGKS